MYLLYSWLHTEVTELSDVSIPAFFPEPKAKRAKVNSKEAARTERTNTIASMQERLAELQKLKKTELEIRQQEMELRWQELEFQKAERAAERQLQREQFQALIKLKTSS